MTDMTAQITIHGQVAPAIAESTSHGRWASWARLNAACDAVPVEGAESPAEINLGDRDIGLLQHGLDWLEQRTGKPVLGVLTYLQGLLLDAEDAITTVAVDRKKEAKLKIVALAYPRVSNHNDLDPLRPHPGVDSRWIGPGETPPAADLIVLPGSKAVRADMEWLRE